MQTTSGSDFSAGSVTRHILALAVPMTVAQLAQIVQSVSIPVVAIGGINRTNAHRLCGIGLAGLAISSGLMHAENVYETAKYLRTLPL